MGDVFGQVLHVIKVKLSVAIQSLTRLRSLKLSDVLHEEDIGQWRRTHYSSEINSSLEDREVIIMGWVSSKRDHGNILFIIIRDRYGDIQVIAKKSECSKRLFGQIQQIKEHTSLAIRGIVRPQDKAPSGFEIIPLELKAFSIAKKADSIYDAK